MSKYTKNSSWFDPDTATSTRIYYRPILRFLSYLKPYKKQIALAAALSLVFSSVAYLIPQVFSWVEQALRQEDVWALTGALTAYLGIMVLQQGTRYLVVRIQAGVYTRLSEEALLGYYRRVLNIRVPEFLHLRQTTNLFQRVIDVMNMTRLFTYIAVTGMLNITSILIFGAVIASIAWQILAALLIGGLVIVAYVLRTTPRLRRLHSQVLGTNYPLVSKMLEIINGMLTIKALTASVGVTQDVRSLVSRRRKTQYDEEVFENEIDSILSTFQALAVVAAIGVGFKLYLDGQLALSSLFATYVIMNAFLTPMKAVARQYRELSKLSVNLKNYYEVMDMDAETESPVLAAGDGAARKAVVPEVASSSHGVVSGSQGHTPAMVNGKGSIASSAIHSGGANRANGVSVSAPVGRVTFENVVFGYKPDVPVLNGVSFDITPGEHVALIGRSGAGKTTIFRLLLGFVRPHSGRILVDGQDIAFYTNLDAHRKRFGIVSQDDFLFDIPIRENLAIGYEELPDEKLIKVLRSVNLWDEIQALENGLAQVYSKDAISGGQRQRLLITRALVRDPDVVLLDEPTSSLDFENEREIIRALDTLVAEKTALIIAHRLSTVRGADRVLVLCDGGIVGDGTHQALYEQNEYYRSLCDFNSVIV